MEDITGFGKLAEQLPELTKEVRELLTLLFKPGIEEMGGIVGDYLKRFRERNAIVGLYKTQKILRQKGIVAKEVSPSITIPIIEGMSFVEEESLQDRWVNLLVTAISFNKVHPSYPEVLKKLDSLDAQILELFRKRTILSEKDILIELEKEKTFTASIPSQRKKEEMYFRIDNLDTLGLISTDSERFEEIRKRATFVFKTSDEPRWGYSKVNLTSYGKRFLWAVSKR